jgi:hypothetical protein
MAGRAVTAGRRLQRRDHRFGSEAAIGHDIDAIVAAFTSVRLAARLTLRTPARRHHALGGVALLRRAHHFSAFTTICGRRRAAAI